MEARPVTDATWRAATDLMKAPKVGQLLKIKVFRTMHGPLPPYRHKLRRVYLCGRCGVLTLRAGSRARYCVKCSKAVNKERCREWRHTH